MPEPNEDEDDEDQLSEQEILDCSEENKECQGGLPHLATQYMMDFGIARQLYYPYEGKKNDRCRREDTMKEERLLLHSRKLQSAPATPATKPPAKKKTLLGLNIFDADSFPADTQTDYSPQ